MSVLKNYLAEFGRASLLEASDPRIGKFFSNKKRGLVVYPFAKTAKGYKVLLSDGSYKSGKPAQKSIHMMDFKDKFYVPDEDPEKYQADKIKAHPKYMGESVLEAKRRPSKAKKQAWMKKTNELLVKLRPKAAGKVDWNLATYLFNQGHSSEEAADKMAKHVKESFKLTDRLRAVAGQDRLPKLGEGDTVEVDAFTKELAGVKPSRPGVVDDGEEYAPAWIDRLGKIKY